MVADPPQARPPDTAVDPLSSELIARAIGDCRIGRVVHYEERIDSTNRLARDLGRQGAADGTIVVAGEQTAGRGRRRRRWASPAGKGVYLSVLLRPAGTEATAAEVGVAIQLVAGVTVAETLAAYCEQPPVLRWPNDCYCGERKVAGVLVESDITGSSLDFLVCGIGVNVNQRESDFPFDLRGSATSLLVESGRLEQRLSVAVALLGALERWDDVWRRRGLAPIMERWLELSPHAVGSYVEVKTSRGVVRGIADGLSQAGGLWVEVETGGRREITEGELVRLTPYTAEAQRRTP